MNKKFNELLSSEEYEFREIASPHYEEFEKLRKYGEGLATLFEYIEENLERIPTQSEYIQMGLLRSEQFFRTNTKRGGYRHFVLEKNPDGSNRWFKFNWDKDERLHQAVKQRLSRTYQSKIAELSIYNQLMDLTDKYDFEIGTHEVLDLVLGVDIALRSESVDKTVYFHVSSESGASWIPTKEKRIIQLSEVDNYYRDFSKHKLITYTPYNSETTTLINGNVTLDNNYVQNKVFEGLINPNSDTYQSEEIEEIKKRLEESTKFPNPTNSDIWATKPQYQLF